MVANPRASAVVSVAVVSVYCSSDCSMLSKLFSIHFSAGALHRTLVGHSGRSGAAEASCYFEKKLPNHLQFLLHRAQLVQIPVRLAPPDFCSALSNVHIRLRAVFGQSELVYCSMFQTYC